MSSKEYLTTENVHNEVMDMSLLEENDYTSMLIIEYNNFKPSMYVYHNGKTIVNYDFEMPQS